MQIIGGAILLGDGAAVTKQVVVPVAPVGPVSGDPNVTLGTTVNWTSNTYFYTANATTIGISGGDHQYDTNNMAYQLFYAHRQIRLPVGSNRYGSVSRSGGSNSVRLLAIVAPNANNRNNWAPNTETVISSTQSWNYVANTLYQAPITTQITIPANRYFLLGQDGGPYYKNYRKTANNITAVNAGNAIVTAINEVYVGPWPSGPNAGVPNQLGGPTASYLKFSGNLFYSAFKFEIV